MWLNMKSNKFKTMKLVIIFILIIFVIINVVKYVSTELRKKESDDIITNMLIIQGKVKLISGEAEVNSNENNYVGTKLSEYDNQDIKSSIQSIGIEESSFENYYILNEENFANMGILNELKNIQDNEYIVNYKETDVIYINGIDIDNAVKYKLSDILNKEEPKIWILYNRIGE